MNISGDPYRPVAGGMRQGKLGEAAASQDDAFLFYKQRKEQEDQDYLAAMALAEQFAEEDEQVFDGSPSFAEVAEKTNGVAQQAFEAPQDDEFSFYRQRKEQEERDYLAAVALSKQFAEEEQRAEEQDEMRRPGVPHPLPEPLQVEANNIPSPRPKPVVNESPLTQNLAPSVSTLVSNNLPVHFASDSRLCVQDDAPVFLYSNQDKDDLHLTLKTAIDNAKESIQMAVYRLTDKTLIAALKKRAQEGVAIHIITDSNASPCDLEKLLGPSIVIVRKGNYGLMHHKIMVVDHKQVWLGSTNYTKASFLENGNILVGVHSPSLAVFIEAKLEEMLKPNRTVAASTALHCNGQTVELSFLPDDNKALDSMVQLIGTAKKTVRVAMYVFTHNDLANALIAAKNRGVDVEVVFDADSAKNISRVTCGNLKRAGVKVLVNTRPGILHYKMMIVDDTTLVAGSANWTKSALNANEDNILTISPLLKEQQEKVSRLWNNIIREGK